MVEHRPSVFVGVLHDDALPFAFRIVLPPCRHASPSVCVSLVTCQLVIFLNMASWQTDHGMSRVVVGKGPPRAPSIFGVLPCFDDTKLFGRAIQRALRY